MENIITSRKNPLILHIKKLGTDRKYRYECGEFLCDGIKLLKEAVMHGAKITSVLYADGFNGIEANDIPDEAKIIKVPQDMISYVSPLKNPQPVLFTCKMNQEPLRAEDIAAPSVILETVQDPGNIGTILRSANAFGIDSVIFLGDCADPYGPKTVRAGMGAVFRQKFLECDFSDVVKIKESGIKILGAALTESAKTIDNTCLENTIVAIGSEGMGLSDKMLKMCDGQVIIPMDPECESLNAGIAASIIMWEMRKA